MIFGKQNFHIKKNPQTLVVYNTRLTFWKNQSTTTF